MQNPKQTKMFLEIVGELRLLIKKEGIKAGGKLPSERVLAETLQVGRSTVREALRSLELLGLIETRRGEGTFLTDFKRHQLVEVLSTFIMQQPNSQLDVNRTRMIHEEAAVSVICEEPSLRQLPVWDGFLVKLQTEGAVRREDIIREMIVATENRLSLKIWFLLKQYSKIPLDVKMSKEENQLVGQFLFHLMKGDKSLALPVYRQWIERIEGERME
ncbi:DNA-binding transcriptional regulator YhcF (GntR family) [Sporosarcina luteola]|nr:DNA-binding transcriptional regulator YhcF (GntR family) [Sporosarcina luteola]